MVQTELILPKWGLHLKIVVIQQVELPSTDINDYRSIFTKIYFNLTHINAIQLAILMDHETQAIICKAK